MQALLSDDLAYARRFNAWLHSLSIEERKTAILAYVYQTLRRKREPFYWALSQPSSQTVNSKNFKTFSTVRKWLEGVGWEITLRDDSWQRYLLYLFENICPENRPDALSPAPGQIKNPLLLKRFLNEIQIPENPTAVRSEKQLKKLYDLIASRMAGE